MNLNCHLFYHVQSKHEWTKPNVTATEGVLKVYHDGGSDVFFGLKIYTLGIFLGQEIGYINARGVTSLSKLFIAISG